jgi:peroxiredoxin
MIKCCNMASFTFIIVCCLILPIGDSLEILSAQPDRCDESFQLVSLGSRLNSLQKPSGSMFLAAAGLPKQVPSFGSPEALLLKAAEEDEVSTLKSLIRRKGINLDVSNRNGQTPLMFAIISHDKEAVMALIDAGADVNKPDNDGNTSVMIAAFLRDLEIVKALHARGADFNRKNSQGLTVKDIVLQRQSYYDSRVNATMAADFKGTRTDGSMIEYSQYRGKKAVLLFFFSTPCQFSQDIEQQVVELRRTYPNEKIEILAVASWGSGDTYGEVRSYQARKNFPFPVIFDSTRRISDTFQPNGTPMFVLIDRQGMIVYRGNNLPGERELRQVL